MALIAYEWRSGTNAGANKPICRLQDGYELSKGFRIPGKWGAAPATMGNATFQQYIDHDNKSLGTFSQLYFYNDEFYKGPGSPVILFTPGEVNATGYTSYLGM